MSIHEYRPLLRVKDVMTVPVITVKNGHSIADAAKAMDKHDIGVVVVVDGKGNPVGIITERDIVRRVLAKNLQPSRVKVSEVMSKPLNTISPDIEVTEAARKMRKLNVRRLPVVENEKLIGIITSKDIVDVTPALVDVLTEKSSIGKPMARREEKPLSGNCEKCGEWADNLGAKEGVLLCEDCYGEYEEK